MSDNKETNNDTTAINAVPVNKLQNIWDLYFKKDYTGVLDNISDTLVKHSVPESLHLAGLSMVNAGKPEIGIVLLQCATSLMPQMSNWYVNASIILCDKFPEESLKFAEDGMKSAKHEVFYFCQGNALVKLKKLKEAKEAFIKGLDINPNSVEILLNLGNTYRKLGNQILSNDCYSKILEVEPNNHRARFNIASNRMAKGEHVDGAKQLCLDYLAIEDNAEVAFMLSLFLLDEGDYIKGWDLYRRRWESNLTFDDRADFRRPIAESLEQIRNKRIVVFHEQGFGDSLQFSRYVNGLQSYTNEIYLAVPNALMKLFKTSYPFANVVNSRDLALPYDYEVPMLNLPYLFGSTLDNLPNTPYLKYDNKNDISYKKENSIIKPKIGLVWAGHRREEEDLKLVDGRRSMSFNDFLKIIDGFPLEWFTSLQLGLPAEQAVNHPIHKLLNSGMDFLDSANLISSLDLVITVDTAPAHLSAGIGVETWNLSREDSCWRWNQKLHKEQGHPRRTEWYPNMSMYYQKTKGDWSNVIEEVRNDLKKRYS